MGVVRGALFQEWSLAVSLVCGFLAAVCQLGVGEYDMRGCWAATAEVMVAASQGLPLIAAPFHLQGSVGIWAWKSLDHHHTQQALVRVGLVSSSSSVRS